MASNRSQDDLRHLARGSLSQINDFFVAREGNKIATFNDLRSFYGLGSQAEARDLFNFATEFAAQLSDIERESRLGTPDRASIPLDTSTPDPTGRNRRYRYQVTVTAGNQHYTLYINGDDLLDIEGVRANALRTLNLWARRYPQIAQFMAENGRDEIEITIVQVTRRY